MRLLLSGWADRPLSLALPGPRRCARGRHPSSSPRGNTPAEFQKVRPARSSLRASPKSRSARSSSSGHWPVMVEDLLHSSAWRSGRSGSRTSSSTGSALSTALASLDHRRDRPTGRDGAEPGPPPGRPHQGVRGAQHEGVAAGLDGTQRDPHLVVSTRGDRRSYWSAVTSPPTGNDGTTVQYPRQNDCTACTWRNGKAR